MTAAAAGHHDGGNGPLAEAAELISRLLDGELSTGDASRLEQLVCARADVRRFYVLNLHLWCTLAPHFTSSLSTSSLQTGHEEAVGATLRAEDAMVIPAFADDDDDDAEHPEPIELPPLNWPPPKPMVYDPWPRRRNIAAAAMAAMVLLTASLVLFWPRQPKGDDRRASADDPHATNRVAVVPTPTPVTQPTVIAPPPPPTRPAVSAVLAAAVGAQWAAPRGDLAVGQPLAAGPLELTSGLAEVNFENGVTLLIEAPARLYLHTNMRAELLSGKVVATVPPPATGFTVDTSAARLVDLGTEFGVEVDHVGETRVEVFRGKVKAAAPASGTQTRNASSQPAAPTSQPATRPTAPKFETRELVAGEAGRVAPGEAAVAEAKPAPLSFVRDDEFEANVAAQRGSTYHRWLAYTYRLRRDPALAAYYTFDKPADPDVVHSDLVPNRSERSLGEFDLQLGYKKLAPTKPAWVQGRWKQKGALDFRPDQCQGAFMPEFPYTTNGALTVSAWVYPRSSRYWAAIVKNRGDSKKSQGQFSLGLFERDGTIVARVTQPDGVEVLTHEAAGSPLPLNAWAHVAMVADGSTLKIYRDGREVSSAPCTGVDARPALKSLSIGYRAGSSSDGTPAVSNAGEYWDGLIDEVAIFHRALTADQMRQMYEAGLPAK
jgi:ferric-dicitrate binding protein FerR (iron transport regulator)